MMVLKFLLDTKMAKVLKHYVFFLPQMSGFIKYFENNKKHMSFLTNDNDDVILKYKKNYAQVNLEQCKFRLNKKKNIELF